MVALKELQSTAPCPLGDQWWWRSSGVITGTYAVSHHRYKEEILYSDGCKALEDIAQGCCAASSLEVFKARLDVILSNLA